MTLAFFYFCTCHNAPRKNSVALISWGLYPKSLYQKGHTRSGTHTVCGVASAKNYGFIGRLNITTEQKQLYQVQRYVIPNIYRPNTNTPAEKINVRLFSPNVKKTQTGTATTFLNQFITWKISRALRFELNLNLNDDTVKLPRVVTVW